MRLAEKLRSTRYRPIAFALVAALAATAVVVPPAVHAQAPSGQAPASSQLTTGQATGINTAGGVIDRVLVRVDGRAILYSDFEGRWQDQLALIASQMPQDQIDAQTPQLRMVMMKGLVEEMLLELRAEELGIVADVNEVDRALMRIREENQLTDDAAWETALAQAGLSEAGMRADIERNIVQQRMIFQEIQRQVFVSNREVVTYYEANPNEFTEPEQVLFQQLIFVYTGNDRAPVRERAENALAELRSGVSLTAVGGKYATPQDLVLDAANAGWLSPEDLQPEILAAVNNLTPLDYSEIVEGRFGFHILQLMDRKDGRLLPLEEVGVSVKNLLTDQKMGVKLQEYTTEMVSKANLETYAEEFAELQTAWNENAPPTGTPGQQR